MSPGHCHFGQGHRMILTHARAHIEKVTCRRVQSGSGDLPILAAVTDRYGGVAAKVGRRPGPRPNPTHARAAPVHQKIP
jgi:hypothetical protein